MAISNQATPQVYQKVDRTAMARMLNLRNILELVDDGFHNGSFVKQEFIHQRHRCIFHIGSNSSDELDIEGVLQFFTQLPGNVALSANNLPNSFRTILERVCDHPHCPVLA